jgi:DnaA family protein
MGLSALLLPLSELTAEDATVLADLEGQGLVAFDDIGAIAGNAAWEEELFHLFNRARAGATTRLVFAAEFLPSGCGFQLPDLISRLAQAPAWRLALPDDDSRQILLEAAARRRDLKMDEGVMRYLVARGPREPGRLLALVALLDRHSLVAGRRLTIPFVRQVLESPEAVANRFTL